MTACSFGDVARRRLGAALALDAKLTRAEVGDDVAGLVQPSAAHDEGAQRIA